MSEVTINGEKYASIEDYLEGKVKLPEIKAGEKATISALDALEKIGITPKIIRLEDDLDPDDYIIKKGSAAYLTHLNNPMSSVVFKINIDKSKTNFNDYNEISTYLKNISKDLIISSKSK